MLKRLRPKSRKGSKARLLEAAHSGNREKVLDFINKGIDINATNEIGVTALHLAAKEGHVGIVSDLLKHGARIDGATGKGVTALHIACLSGKVEVIELLLENNAKVNVQSQDGFTPIYMAAQENHVDAVRCLLSAGASQSLTTEDGFTPLAVALQQGHDDVANVLLSHGTSSKLKLPQIHLVTKKGDVRAVALLLKRNEENVNITSKSGFTPLHIAGHYGNVDIGRILIAKGAAVNASAKNDITPLHVACKRGRTAMVSLLLDSEADVKCQTKDGMTPLHCAAVTGGSKISACLLQRGASVNAKTKNGFTPLHHAIQGDHTNCAKQLLLYGAPINEVSTELLTPLHVAAYCGNLRSVRFLLDKKCDVNPKAKNDCTPLHIAVKKKHKEIVELLGKYGAKVEAKTEAGLTPLHVASLVGHTGVVAALLQLRANPDCVTQGGDTPLHFATKNRHLGVIDLLLHNGSQVDSRAADQVTPLHIAVQNGDYDSTSLLLHHGASPDAKTTDLNTPLHLAASATASGIEDVARILLEHGANPNTASKNGFTPLHVAAKQSNVRVARLLLSRNDVEPDVTCDSDLTPLHIAVHYNQINAALLLLERGAKPNSGAKNGYTTLHVAAAENRMNLVPYLLEHGANINAESQMGFTPLDLSCKAGHLAMTSLLLERGANVTHGSSEGLTPLHLAALTNRVSFAEILTQFGANINAQTKSGIRPIHLANQCGHTAMTEFLIGRDAEIGAIPLTTENKLSETLNDADAGIAATSSASDATFQQNQLTPLTIIQPDEVSDLFAFDIKPDMGNASMQSPTSQPLQMEQGSFDINEPKRLDVDSPIECKDFPLSSTEPRLEPSVETAAGAFPHHNPSCLRDGSQRPSSAGFSSNFLISFLVDARGGSMQGSRFSGIRMVVPPDTASMPTRVTCRYMKKEKSLNLPLLADGEGLAARILEVGPEGTTFEGPVLIEVSHFASLHGGEREIVIMRSDNGHRWSQHVAPTLDDSTFQSLFGTSDNSPQKVKIVTSSFPRYFALISRFRHEVANVGPEGAVLCSSRVADLKAVLPPGSIKKATKVQLQVHPIADDLVAKFCGTEVESVSPVVTIEPRHRRFHQPIAITIPLPKSMIGNEQIKKSKLKVLASQSEGSKAAVWEDVTDLIALTILNGGATLLVTVSARYWLIDSSDMDISLNRLTDLYEETLAVPFWSKFIAFAKRVNEVEALVRLFAITEDQYEKTFESQENFSLVGKSADIEVFNGRPLNVNLSGNLLHQNTDQNLCINFHAFRENRLPFSVNVDSSRKNQSVQATLTYKPKTQLTESVTPTVVHVLDVKIPDLTDEEKLNLEGKTVQKTAAVALQSETQISKAELHLTDIADILDADWLPLAVQLELSPAEINEIKSDYDFLPEQALVMLHQWVMKNREKATGNSLEKALKLIGRADVIAACMHNIREVTDDTEKLVAKGYIHGSDGKDETSFECLSSRESILRSQFSSDISCGDVSSIPDSRSLCYDTGSEVSSVAGKDDFPKSYDDQGDENIFYADGSINSSAYNTLRSIESEESDAMLTDEASDYEAGGNRDGWIHPQWKKVVLRKSKNEAHVMADASVRLSQVSDATVTGEDESDRELTPCVYEIESHHKTEKVHQVIVQEQNRDLEKGPGIENIKLLNSEGSKIVREVIEGDMFLTTNIRNTEEVLKDGMIVKRRIVTRKHMQPVEEKVLKNSDVLETKSYEKVIRIDVEEDITELEPGVSNEFEAQLECDATSEEVVEVLPDGVEVLKKINKVRMTRKESIASLSESESSETSGNSATGRQLNCDDVIHEHDESVHFDISVPSTPIEIMEHQKLITPNSDLVQGDLFLKQSTVPGGILEEHKLGFRDTSVISSSNLKGAEIIEEEREQVTPKLSRSAVTSPEKNIKVERTVGEIILETEENMKERSSDNGNTVTRKITTTRHLLPVTEKIRFGQIVKVLDRFDLVGVEVQEEIVTVPETGEVEDEVETLIEESEETQVDGTWLKKKTTYITTKPKQICSTLQFDVGVNGEINLKPCYGSDDVHQKMDDKKDHLGSTGVSVMGNNRVALDSDLYQPGVIEKMALENDEAIKKLRQKLTGERDHNVFARNIATQDINREISQENMSGERKVLQQTCLDTDLNNQITRDHRNKLETMTPWENAKPREPYMTTGCINGYTAENVHVRLEPGAHETSKELDQRVLMDNKRSKQTTEKKPNYDAERLVLVSDDKANKGNNYVHGDNSSVQTSFLYVEGLNSDVDEGTPVDRLVTEINPKLSSDINKTTPPVGLGIDKKHDEGAMKFETGRVLNPAEFQARTSLGSNESGREISQRETSRIAGLSKIVPKASFNADKIGMEQSSRNDEISNNIAQKSSTVLNPQNMVNNGDIFNTQTYSSSFLVDKTRKEAQGSEIGQEQKQGVLEHFKVVDASGRGKNLEREPLVLPRDHLTGSTEEQTQPRISEKMIDSKIAEMLNSGQFRHLGFGSDASQRRHTNESKQSVLDGLENTTAHHSADQRPYTAQYTMQSPVGTFSCSIFAEREPCSVKDNNESSSVLSHIRRDMCNTSSEDLLFGKSERGYKRDIFANEPTETSIHKERPERFGKMSETTVADGGFSKELSQRPMQMHISSDLLSHRPSEMVSSEQSSGNQRLDNRAAEFNNSALSMDIQKHVASSKPESSEDEASTETNPERPTTPRSQRINFSRGERRMLRMSQDGAKEENLTSPSTPSTGSTYNTPYFQTTQSSQQPFSLSQRRSQSPFSSGAEERGTESRLYGSLHSPYSSRKHGAAFPPMKLEMPSYNSSERDQSSYQPKRGFESPTSVRRDFGISSTRRERSIPSFASAEHDILPSDTFVRNLENRLNTLPPIAPGRSSTIGRDSRSNPLSVRHDSWGDISSLSDNVFALSSPVRADVCSPTSPAGSGRTIPFRNRMRRYSREASPIGSADSMSNTPTTTISRPDFSPLRSREYSSPPGMESHEGTYNSSKFVMEQTSGRQRNDSETSASEDFIPPSRRPSLLQSTLESHSRFLDAIAKIDEIAPGLLLSPTLRGPDVTQETVKGKIQCSTVENKDKTFESGDRTIIVKGTTIRYFQPVVRNFYRDGVLIDQRTSEMILGKYVDEYIHDTPTDLTNLTDWSSDTTTSVDVSEETLSDGTWLKRKTTKIIVGPTAEEQKEQKVSSGQLAHSAVNSAANRSQNLESRLPLSKPITSHSVPLPLMPTSRSENRSVDFSYRAGVRPRETELKTAVQDVRSIAAVTASVPALGSVCNVSGSSSSDQTSVKTENTVLQTATEISAEVNPDKNKQTKVSTVDPEKSPTQVEATMNLGQPKMSVPIEKTKVLDQSVTDVQGHTDSAPSIAAAVADVSSKDEQSSLKTVAPKMSAPIEQTKELDQSVNVQVRTDCAPSPVTAVADVSSTKEQSGLKTVVPNLSNSEAGVCSDSHELQPKTSIPTEKLNDLDSSVQVHVDSAPIPATLSDVRSTEEKPGSETVPNVSNSEVKICSGSTEHQVTENSLKEIAIASKEITEEAEGSVKISSACDLVNPGSSVTVPINSVNNQQETCASLPSEPSRTTEEIKDTPPDENKIAKETKVERPTEEREFHSTETVPSSGIDETDVKKTEEHPITNSTETASEKDVKTSKQDSDAGDWV